VSAAGKLALTFKGKEVATLAKGRYTITVTDKSKKSGFILQGTGQKAIVVSAAGYVGKRSTTIDLTAGQWFFYPTFVGAKTYFLVESSA
jgi:predicted secreted protein